MLDPAILRDQMDAVRAGLRNRGLTADADLERLVALETRRRAPVAGGRGAEAPAERRRGRSRAREAPGARPVGGFRDEQGPGAADQAARGRAGTGRAERDRAADDAAQPPPRERASRELRGQSGGPPPRRAARIRLRAETALGPRHGAGHPRLRARDAHVGRAVLGAARRGRAAGARADQLHARAPHAASTATPRWSRRFSSTPTRCAGPATCPSSSRISSRSPASGTCS